jgi:hypothetical protein
LQALISYKEEETQEMKTHFPQVKRVVPWEDHHLFQQLQFPAFSVRILNSHLWNTVSHQKIKTVLWQSTSCYLTQYAKSFCPSSPFCTTALVNRGHSQFHILQKAFLFAVRCFAPV